jgi:hypothetical protein
MIRHTYTLCITLLLATLLPHTLVIVTTQQPVLGRAVRHQAQVRIPRPFQNRPSLSQGAFWVPVTVAACTAANPGTATGRSPLVDAAPATAHTPVTLITFAVVSHGPAISIIVVTIFNIPDP